MKRALLLLMLCGCASNAPTPPAAAELSDEEYLAAYKTAAKQQAYESVGFLHGQQARIHRDKLQSFYDALMKNPPKRSSSLWQMHEEKCAALKTALMSAPDADGFITAKR